MDNPFEQIIKRLNRLEDLINEINYRLENLTPH